MVMADSNSKGYRKLTRKPLQRPLDKQHSIEAYYIHKLYSTCLPFNSDIQRYSEQDVFKELVKLAINILDFDRFGILLLSEDRQTMIGTWGTDSNGEIVDETDFSSPIDANLEPIMSAVKDQGQIILWDEVDILDFDRQSKNGVNHIGMGWNAGYAFWVNNRIAGWVAADNLLNKQEFSAIHQQLFRMIGDFIGQFLTAKMQM